MGEDQLAGRGAERRASPSGPPEVARPRVRDTARAEVGSSAAPTVRRESVRPPARQPSKPRPGPTRRLAPVPPGTGVVVALTALVQLVVVGRWLAQSHALGATGLGQAYATAFQVPSIVFEVTVGGALVAAFGPLLAAPVARKLTEVERTASAVLTWSLVLLIPLGALLALAAGPIAALLVPDRQPGVELAASLLRVFAVQVPLYGLAAVLAGVLLAYRKATWLIVAPLAALVVLIGTFLAGAAHTRHAPTPTVATPGASLLAWGTTAAVAAVCLALLVGVARTGVRLGLTLRFPAGVGRRGTRLAAAGLAAVIAQQVTVLVTLILANTKGAAGSLNVFQYATAVYLVPFAVLVVPLAVTAFPRMAAADREVVVHPGVTLAGTPAVLAPGAGVTVAVDPPQVTRTAGLATRVVITVSTIAAGMLIATAGTAQALFAAVDAGHVDGLAEAITWLAPGLVGLALTFHLGRVLTVLGRGRAAVAATAIGWGVVVGASIVLVTIVPTGEGPATLRGLALGSSIGLLTAGMLLVHAVRLALGNSGLAGLNQTVAVAVGSTALATLAGRLLVDRLVDTSALGAAAAGILVVGGIAVIAVGIGDPTVIREIRRALR